MNKFTQAMGIAAISAAIGLALPSTAEASPATVHTITFLGVTGQLDTSPGNGAASWVWGSNSSPGYTNHVDYQFYDGEIKNLYIPPNSSVSVNASKDVWRIRVCSYSLINHDQCSGWS
ncbi:hypothetical protein [Streptomyces tendae]|uniref:hypothetical protein n=1 Tax=Streptomyces tendae TaxID=1932 RepID=UPI003D7241DA